MNIRIYIVAILLCFVHLSIAQSNTEAYCENHLFQSEIDKYLAYSVPIITVEQLSSSIDDYVLLDAREKPEYDISHIKGARHVGYNALNYELINQLNKKDKIVIYCSIGYRSEKIGEYLQSTGFEHVFNLYGSIFEWANQDKVLVNNRGVKTNQLHAFNKEWSQWIDNSQIEKIIR